MFLRFKKHWFISLHTAKKRIILLSTFALFLVKISKDSLIKMHLLGKQNGHKIFCLVSRENKYNLPVGLVKFSCFTNILLAPLAEICTCFKTNALN